MRLRNNPNGSANNKSQDDEEADGGDSDTWQPSMEGFLSYLVDSKLVFNTVERIIDESGDVSCKSDCLFFLKDLNLIHCQ